MEAKIKKPELFEILRIKSNLKQDVYEQIRSTFELIRASLSSITEDYYKTHETALPIIPFEFKDRGEFELELRFGGDVLIFMMHTNVFQFSRMHEVMKTNYIHQDNTLSYCGVIHIYNFLADSFKYNRTNDIGYLIGRLFVNRESHYFIEGKREIGMLYNNFATSVISPETIRQIIESAMLYTINFDLLSPPYDQVKLVTVNEMQNSLDNMKITTGKRLGFRFQADNGEPKD
ncbi:MAG: hypothetical protein RBR28_05775 [Lentimicrobium sp.]|jgi:hypothetical protein|nr:hypothetical protein [Lentimicrobium sp.]